MDDGTILFNFQLCRVVDSVIDFHHFPVDDGVGELFEEPVGTREQVEQFFG